MPSRFQEMLYNQRQNPETSRAGLKWEPNEDDQMLAMLAEGQTFSDIAKTLQITEGSIKTRLTIYAVNKMENDKLSASQVAGMLHLTVEDITEYQQRKQSREERLRDKKRAPPVASTKEYSKRSDNVSNNDIYELLLTMNKSLDTLVRSRR